MRFISIDIETLGLNQKAPIIEVGAVCAETHPECKVLGTFHTYVLHPTYDNCEPYAMSMHPEALRRIATQDKDFAYCRIRKLAKHFGSWSKQFFPEEPINFAGKNAAGFDLPMLEAQALWSSEVWYRHRVFDVGSLFWQPDLHNLESQSEILKRCGLPEEVSHSALDDAWQVVDLIFYYTAERMGFHRVS